MTYDAGSSGGALAGVYGVLYIATAPSLSLLAVITGFFVMFFTLFLLAASMVIDDSRWSCAAYCGGVA